MGILVFICLTVLINVSRSANHRSSISFHHYNRYNEIVSYINHLQKSHPDILRIEHIGKSHEGRAIPCVRISSDLSSRTRPMIMLDGGIHAREWMSPAVNLYTIHQLVEKAKNRNMIEKVDWVIIPVVNPDGYEYSHTKDRMWRKNRARGKKCDGVDLNRNFGFHFMEKDSSDDECSEIFAGKRAFSEPESQALRNVTLRYKSQIKLYVTFHSYGPMMLYPWSYSGKQVSNAKEHKELGKKLVDAIKHVRGTKYNFGASSEIFYDISGVSDDWVRSVIDDSMTFTIELPPGGSEGFHPPTSHIVPVTNETFAAVKVMHTYIERHAKKRKHSKNRYLHMG